MAPKKIAVWEPRVAQKKIAVWEAPTGAHGKENKEKSIDARREPKENLVSTSCAEPEVKIYFATRRRFFGIGRIFFGMDVLRPTSLQNRFGMYVVRPTCRQRHTPCGVMRQHVGSGEL